MRVNYGVDFIIYLIMNIVYYYKINGFSIITSFRFVRSRVQDPIIGKV